MTRRILTDTGWKNVLVNSDTKPAKRVRATAAEWEKIREKKLAGWPCRVCNQAVAEELHHLVPRGMGGTIGGGDVVENLVPLCQECHARVEARDPWAASLLGARLTRAEREYVLVTKGAWYLEKRYGVKEAA